MNKKERQQIILKAIEEREIDTQEELASIINGYGANATQVTVSRDINELNLVKIAGKVKKYRYAKTVIEDEEQVLNNLGFYREAVISVEDACNLVVVKTLAGSANAVAVIIDKMRIKEFIVGSVAGDDTLIIVTKHNKNAQFLAKKLKELKVKND